MSEPTASKGDQTRAEILDAARKLFTSKGYSATSMRDIAEASGNRAVAGLYNHFANKKALFEALFAERNPYEELVNLLEANHGDTAAAFIRNGLSQVMPLMARHFSFVELVEIDIREFGGENLRREMSSILPRAFMVAQRVSALPGMRPIESLALIRLLASTVIGFIATESLAAKLLGGQYSQAEWVEKYVSMVIHGLVEPDDGA